MTTGDRLGLQINELLVLGFRIGMTWDQALPALNRGARVSLDRLDEDTWRCRYRFTFYDGSSGLYALVFHREAETPYLLTELMEL